MLTGPLNCTKGHCRFKVQLREFTLHFVTSTPKTWNPRLLEPCANFKSNQNRSPQPDFGHAFTVLIPSVTRLFEFPLTRNNFRLPSGHFLFRFMFSDWNHVCQYVKTQNNQ